MFILNFSSVKNRILTVIAICNPIEKRNCFCRASWHMTFLNEYSQQLNLPQQKKKGGYKTITVVHIVNFIQLWFNTASLFVYISLNCKWHHVCVCVHKFWFILTLDNICEYIFYETKWKNRLVSTYILCI